MPFGVKGDDGKAGAGQFLGNRHDVLAHALQPRLGISVVFGHHAAGGVHHEEDIEVGGGCCG
jgi:hypothetical protein